MKSLIRMGLFLAVTALVMIAPASAFMVKAQGTADNCFGLKAEDCALANTDMSGAAGKLSSFNMDYELTLKLNGGSSSSNIDLSVKGSGPLGLSGETMGQIARGDANAVLSGLVMANTIAASVTSNGSTTSGNFEFRIINDTLYFQGDKATGGQWKSIDLKTVTRRQGIRRLGAGVNPLQAVRAFGDLQKLRQTSGLIKAERSVDATIENQPIAVFIYHIDLPTLFNAPEFAQLIQTGMRSSAAGSRMTEAQIKQMTSGLAAAFKGSSLSVTRLVGTTDKLPHGLGIDFTAKLDPSVMALAGGGAPGVTNAAPVDINLHFLVQLSGIGSKANVTAPTGATPLDLGPMIAEPTSEATIAATMAATPAK